MACECCKAWGPERCARCRANTDGAAKLALQVATEDRMVVLSGGRVSRIAMHYPPMVSER